MGYIVWPICVAFVFGSRYFTGKYEEEHTQSLKILCGMGLAASGFTLVIWGFALGMITAGTIQELVNLSRYAKNAKEFGTGLGENIHLIKLGDGTMAIVKLVILITVLAVICFFAFRSMMSYLTVLKTGRRNTKKDIIKNSKLSNKKELKPREEVAFCNKCGARLASSDTHCPACGHIRFKGKEKP
jgi:ribosomal protein L40E